MTNYQKRVQRRYYHLRKYKQKCGCANCGYNKDPIALCFAHINQMDKHPKLLGRITSGISPLVRKVYVTKKNWGKNTDAIRLLFNEIRKCKILCVNCHTIETYKEGQMNGKDIAEKRNKINLYEQKNGIKLKKFNIMYDTPTLDRFFR